MNHRILDRQTDAYQKEWYESPCMEARATLALRCWARLSDRTYNTHQVIKGMKSEAKG